MRPHLLFLFVCLGTTSYGQYFSREPICGSDTLLVSRRSERNHDTSKFRAIECLVPGKIGLRIDIGGTSYRYNPATASWLGKHSAGSFGLLVIYNHVNIGVRLKLSSVTPKRPLVFGTDTLQSPARVNPNKLDYSLGYSFDFKYNFSLEPFVGYTTSPFYAVNDSATGSKKEYSIPVARGLLLGLSANKYFKIRGFEYVALFSNIRYATTDYTKIDGSLGQGYIEWTFGLAYKGFPNIRYYKKVD